MPLLLELLGAVRVAGRLPEVLLVDGTGILHQRHAGIASHLGVAAGLPTVGVTKKLLCGQVDLEGLEPGQSCLVVLDEEIVGVALRPTATSRRPTSVSPGTGGPFATLRAGGAEATHRKAFAGAALLGRSA